MDGAMAASANESSALGEEFVQRCHVLGQDVEDARTPGGTTRFLRVPSLAAFSRLIPASLEERRQRAESFFNPGIAARRRLGQGLHDRGEASVFAVGDLSEDDRKGLAHHLPLRIKAISATHHVIPAGETWDVSQRGADWGIDELEELYVVLNIGTLVIEPGARLIVRGNVFMVCIQSLIVQPAPAEQYQIGILPTPFSVDLRDGPMRGADGVAGADGMHGVEGGRIDTQACLLGHVPIGEANPAALHGTPGTDGGDGTRGERGRTGGMCKLADIAIRHLEGRLRVFAQPGPGGDGGDGGAGGCGGNGGAGHAGPYLVQGKLPDGAGGAAGAGGQGGAGGPAGGGGIASNIYLSVPEPARHSVICESLPSRPGTPGRGGAGGRAGRPGPAEADGQPGAAAPDGAPGADGPTARGRPAPWMFVNGRKAAPVP